MRILKLFFLSSLIILQAKDSRFNPESALNYEYIQGENYMQNPFAILPFGKIKKDDKRQFIAPPSSEAKTPPKKPSFSESIKPKDSTISPKIEFKNVKKPLKLEPEIVVEPQKPKELLIPNYDSKLQRLLNLRYEVFSLKQQLGDVERADVPYGEFINIDSSAKTFNTLAQSYNDAKAKSGFFGGASVGLVDIYTSGCIFNGMVNNPNYVPGSSQPQQIRTCTNTTTQNTPMIFGGNGGYQRFFNHYVGARLWGGIFSTLMTNIQEYNINNGMYETKLDALNQNIQSYYLLAHMSADMLFEFPINKKFKHYIGAFFGINIGVMYYRPYTNRVAQNDFYPADYIWSYNLQVDYSFNLGFNITLFNKNRLEVGIALPLAFLELPGFKEIAASTATGMESNIMLEPQHSIGTPLKPDFWRGALFSINFKRVIF